MHHGEARVLKRPLPVSSTEDSPLSEAVVVELNATRDVNNLRKRAKQLGVLVDYQTSDGQWHKRTREYILDECRRRPEQSHGPVEVAASFVSNFHNLEQEASFIQELATGEVQELSLIHI